MNRKSKQRIIVINLLLFALLFGLVSLNKEFLRPLYSNTPIIKVLIGSFPNFIAAYIISLAFMNVVVIREPKYGRLIVYLSSLLVFAILTTEEFKPIWGASTHYDSFDIFANGLGSLLAILTFELVILKRKTK
ncbi:hypothetical protein ES705_38192 [subsurface metagenome]